MIYFVLNASRKAVKIGYSANVVRRLNGLQTSSPDKLKLLGVCPGSRSEEVELHVRFATLHIRGEWFRADPELLATAKAMCAAHRLHGRCPRCGKPNADLYESSRIDGFVCEGCELPGGLPATLRRSHAQQDPQRQPSGGGYRIVRKRGR